MNKKERSESLSPSAPHIHCGLDLQRFREVLAVLQRQVNELDELKVSHYREIVDHEEEVMLLTFYVPYNSTIVSGMGRCPSKGMVA